MKTLVLTAAMVASASLVQAQINTGSNGSDGALNPASSITINMANHPTGIYQYTYVNIPTNVTVSFIPNANNTPVYWLVQGNVVINGTVNLSGQTAIGQTGGLGGPGGYRGGDGGVAASSGQGPGGGIDSLFGGNASYGSLGSTNSSAPPGPVYGNVYLVPLLGGSGGGGSTNVLGGGSGGGGGGGGAFLVAASGYIELDGSLNVSGGGTALGGGAGYLEGGGGSGGAVRIIASKITGAGGVYTGGGAGGGYIYAHPAGIGRVRFDTYENDFSGGISGVFSLGSQFIIVPTAGQLPQLRVTSVGGVSVSASPTGVLSTPDAVLSAQQNNPISIVVSCENLPLHSLITVSVTPANGSPVSATGYNDTGTQTSSIATISINIPRGGGLIYATAATSN